jgi:2-polyprenyl-6-methoxyphenol hydroxylase-like FAD-dependent oxidoreductase
VTVRRGYEVTDLRDTSDGVVAVYVGPDGSGEDSAGYLVGCDGSQSSFRTLAGIEVSGWEATRSMYTAEITGIEIRQRPIGERLLGGNMVVCTSLRDGCYRIVVHDKGLPARLEPGALTFTKVVDAWQPLTGESIHHA